jgi:ribonuclease inhibitor
MTTVTIDGNAIKAEEDLHALLAGALDFGPYYGSNLAALWDRLSTDVPRPVMIIWEHASASRKNLGDELFERIISLFEAVRGQDDEMGLKDRFEFHFID